MILTDFTLHQLCLNIQQWDTHLMILTSAKVQMSPLLAVHTKINHSTAAVLT